MRGAASAVSGARSEACVSGWGAAGVMGAVLQGEATDCELDMLTPVSLIPLLGARTVKRCSVPVNPLKVKVLVTQSVSDSVRPPMDSSLPDSSVHGILQAGTLEWVAVSFSRGSCQPRD